jgi:hypothetical protein
MSAEIGRLWDGLESSGLARSKIYDDDEDDYVYSEWDEGEKRRQGSSARPSDSSSVLTPHRVEAVPNDP